MRRIIAFATIILLCLSSCTISQNRISFSSSTDIEKASASSDPAESPDDVLAFFYGISAEYALWSAELPDSCSRIRLIAGPSEEQPEEEVLFTVGPSSSAAGADIRIGYLYDGDGRIRITAEYGHEKNSAEIDLSSEMEAALKETASIHLECQKLCSQIGAAEGTIPLLQITILDSSDEVLYQRIFSVSFE